MSRIERRHRWMYAVIAVYLVVFFLLTVRSGDDFRRLAMLEQINAGGANFFEVISRYYINTNGRVLGNSLHLALSTSFVVNAVTRAAVILGIVWAIARVSRLRELTFLPLILLVLLAPTVPILKQAIVWSAGFYNYVVPVLLILLLVLLLRGTSTPLKVLGTFVCAIAACLFMETVTLGLGIFAIVWVVASLVQRRFVPRIAALGSGTLIGAILMFASPAYRSILAGDDAYRPMLGNDAGPVAALLARIVENAPKLAQTLLLDGALFFFLIFAALVFLASGRGRGPGWLLPGIVVGTTGTLVLLREIDALAVGGWLEPVLGFGTLLLGLVASGAVVLMLRRTGDARLREASWWIAAAVGLTFPLLIVSPFGARNIFVTAVGVVVATVIAASERIGSVKPSAFPARTVFVACGAIAFVLLGVLGVNKAVDVANAHSAAVQYDSGANTIVLRAYPFPSLVQDAANGKKYLQSLQTYTCNFEECTKSRSAEIIFE